MMTGNKNFKSIYNQQCQFQHKVTKKTGLPVDDVNWSSYHILGLVEEVGELLKADKRWKTHRNTFFDEKNKLTEIADVFITTLNVAIFSGFSEKQVYEAVIKKIEENTNKLKEEK